MFYEKLADAKEDKRSRKKRIARRGLGALGVATLGLGAGPASNALSDIVSKRTRRTDEHEHIKRIANKINPNIAQVIHDDNVPDLVKNAPFFDRPQARLDLRDLLQSGAGFAANQAIDTSTGEYVVNPSFTRGAISAPLHASDTTSLMHELGHATGKLRRGKSKLYDALYDKSYAFSGAPGTALGLLRTGVESANVSRAKSEKDLDKIERRNRVLTATQGLLSSPHLFEEGRANIRAVGLGKKFGAKVNKAALATRMGTYLSGVGAQTLIPHYLTKYQINKRRKELRESKTRNA
jgi:hypothetical protein